MTANSFSHHHRKLASCIYTAAVSDCVCLRKCPRLLRVSSVVTPSSPGHPTPWGSLHCRTARGAPVPPVTEPGTPEPTPLSLRCSALAQSPQRAGAAGPSCAGGWGESWPPASAGLASALSASAPLGSVGAGPLRCTQVSTESLPGGWTSFSPWPWS